MFQKYFIQKNSNNFFLNCENKVKKLNKHFVLNTGKLKMKT